MLNKIANKKTGVYVLFILLSAIFGWFSHSYYNLYIQDHSKDIIQVRENDPDYKFIKPIIFVADLRKIEFERYSGLKEKIDVYIKKIIKDKKAKRVSVYFRNLDSSEWFGIGEDDLYAPGSMLKVSTLIAYLKLAEENPEILLKTAPYKILKNDEGQFYKPKKLFYEGNYTIRNLLQQMIIESDNNAMRTLDKLATPKIISIYKDLQLPDPLQESIDFMSPREYSRIFRTLYNGSYISNTYSEQALNLLSNTSFYNGLVSGVGSTTISHKFGEFTETRDGTTIRHQLHDCGIIYNKNAPYFLCVMTEGKDFKDLEKVISDISKDVFEFENKIVY